MGDCSYWTEFENERELLSVFLFKGSSGCDLCRAVCTFFQGYPFS